MEARWRRPRWRKDPLWVLLVWMLKNLLLFMFSVVQKPAERDQCAEGGDLCDEEDGIWKEKATAEGDWNSYSDKKRYWGEKSLKSTPYSREAHNYISKMCPKLKLCKARSKNTLWTCVFRSSTDALRPSSGVCTSSWAGLRMHTGTDKELSTQNCAPPFYWNNNAKC